MIYKPNYCNNCGEKIERIEWKFFTSTRFCESCEFDFKVQDWLPRGVIGVGVLGIVFGVGSWMKTPEKNVQIAANQLPIVSTKEVSESSKKETMVSSQVEKNTSVAKEEPKALLKQIKPQNVESAKPEVNAATPQKATQSIAPQVVQNEPAEVVYFCGAKTKKGTPCSRKVKGKERCWQHVGEAPMLPQEKLKVN